MENYKSITNEELLKDNLRFCLSPKRVFNKCYDCPEYSKKDNKGNIKVCESRIINIDYNNKLNKINSLKEQINILEEELRGLLKWFLKNIIKNF